MKYWWIGLTNMKNDLVLNREIYTEKCILKAIEDFSSVCDVEICKDNKYICCDFNNFSIDKNIIKKEFENYVIGYMGKYGN